MARLEDLTRGASVRSILPDALVTVNSPSASPSYAIRPRIATRAFQVDAIPEYDRISAP